MCEKGKLVVISGPSGVGKGTLCKFLLEKHPDLGYSVSATTRNSRPGEQNGVNYFFLSEEEFVQMIQDDGFLEWAQLFGNFYGTPGFAVDKQLESGQSVILEIDTQGAIQVMQKRTDCVSVFIMPPTWSDLEKRIKGRGTETHEAINIRLERAKKEMTLASVYNYTVINDEIERAVKDLENIFLSEGILPKNKGAKIL